MGQTEGRAVHTDEFSKSTRNGKFLFLPAYTCIFGMRLFTCEFFVYACACARACV
jgi:hypothetical protein